MTLTTSGPTRSNKVACPPKPEEAGLATGVPADLARKASWRSRLSRLKQRFAIRAAVPFSRVYGPRVPGSLGILMYHRVTTPAAGVPEPTFNVSPDQFRRQLTGLLARGFVAWPLRRALDAHRRGNAFPERTFVVTFDDGYENVFTNAFPILRDLGVPATVFLSTAYLDSSSPFPFDDWTAKGETPAPHWRPLTTRQCLTMQQSGLIELACHTHTHADFRDRPDELLRDLNVSLAALRDRFGLTDATFAFPYGTRSAGFSGPVLASSCRQAGLLCSLTTEEELVVKESDPFDWGRFTAEQSDCAETLAAKIDGWYSLLRSAWRRLRHPGRTTTGEPERRRTITADSLPNRSR